MNVAYFILTVVLISFATGFVVAAIIWFIKWSILLGENKESVQTHVFHFFSGLIHHKFRKLGYPSGNTTNDSLNIELFNFYHGKN